MNLQDYNYNLPKELIAQRPLGERDSSRLFIVDRGKNTFYHKNFYEIKDFLNNGDVLILNNTKVLPARLLGSKITGGKVDILLLNRQDGCFDALIKPAQKPKTKILFSGSALEAEVIDNNRVRFNTDKEDEIYKLGCMPLPPYIKRLPDESDKEAYQTVFSKIEGAIASPTAGLHFTEELLGILKKKGVKINFITLHVNYATFKPVKENDIRNHKMHKEYYSIKKDTISAVKDAKKSKNRIFACGTTVARALETVACLPNTDLIEGSEYSGFTDIFIYPGYKFKVVDSLITNFHLPKTTLLMLVSAFMGHELMMKAYREAIDEKYRFYSYGDAMLIL